jgi:hypothetical protein
MKVRCVSLILLRRNVKERLVIVIVSPPHSIHLDLPSLKTLTYFLLHFVSRFYFTLLELTPTQGGLGCKSVFTQKFSKKQY